ncbi:transcriptional regulator, GntR family [Sporolituus thermophilus DSM 23256]|uniref:Transcriptional regulator, GntR family n=2 Tax=Sporolituus TaxID=909931 RepID=A0A1G7N320_9FIRM|nr:transcriptional regulator, GntR family [Sporolituus thermophilus DSM 23256]
MLPIKIDYTSGIPIYVQIKEAIQNAIRTGAYPQGAQLPTVRQLAVQLKINANTVSRAYTELEREGVISSQQGRGTFVTMPTDIDYAKLAQLEAKVVRLLEEAAALGFSAADVQAVLDNAVRQSTLLTRKEV